MSQTPQPEEQQNAVDAAAEPLHVAESFRRAKRNVLFWSVTTTLLALALNDGGPVEVTGVVRNLQFSQQTLVLGSLIVLVFMNLAYIRADRELVIRNSPFERGTALKSASELIRQLNKDIARLKADAKNAREALGELVSGSLEKTKAAINQVDDNLKFSTSEISKMVELSGKIERIAAEKAKADKAAEEARNAPAKTRAAAERYASNMRQQVDYAEAELQTHHGAIMKSNEQARDALSVIREIDTARKKIKEIEEVDLEAVQSYFPDMHSIAETVALGDRRWFWVFDRGAVAVISSVAIYAALTRLIASERIGNFLDYWSLALETAG